MKLQQPLESLLDRIIERMQKQCAHNAKSNWIQHAGNQSVYDRAHTIWHGNNANKLLNSPDFNYIPFAYAVWEVTDNTYDNQTDADKYACIHRSSQSTLQGALEYMTSENRVLVENMHPRETITI